MGGPQIHTTASNVSQVLHTTNALSQSDGPLSEVISSIIVVIKTGGGRGEDRHPQETLYHWLK